MREVGKLLDRIIANHWFPETNQYGKPYKVNKQQMRCLLYIGKELFFGGAAGPGKSEYLLQAPSMWLDIPRFSGIIFRRTIASLLKEGGLIPRSKEWWLGKADPWGNVAKWNGSELKWTFPLPELYDELGDDISGWSKPAICPTLAFGYMAHEDDYVKYGSTEYQYIGWDEVTECREFDYRFMFSRLRGSRDVTQHLNPFCRAASNPIGQGVVWVKRRFNLPEGDLERPYIPATLQDNAANVDIDLYMESLAELDPITRQRLVNGDWTVQDPGRMFDRTWFINQNHPSLPRLPSPDAVAVRFWDLASSLPKKHSDPDYTCGLLMAKLNRQYYVCDVKRFRLDPKSVEDRVLQCAVEDSARGFSRYEVRMEQEPGSSGVNTISHYARLLSGFTFYGERSTGPKQERARPFSSMAANGHVWLLNGQWQTEYLDELEAFPFGSHDDQTDASSGAFNRLATVPEGDLQFGFAKRPP